MGDDTTSTSASPTASENFSEPQSFYGSNRDYRILPALSKSSSCHIVASSSYPPLAEVSSDLALSALKSSAATFPILAMYSSIWNGVLREPSTMLIPFGDHMVHRGHAVFDTGTLVNHRLYALQDHLDRFWNSIRLARINNPFRSKDEIRHLINETCRVAGVPSGILRYWLSSGGSDLLLHPADNAKPTFWITLQPIGDCLSPSAVGVIPEAKIPASLVPLKQSFFVHAKTTNYLLNAVVTVEARRLGGTHGLWIDAEGNLGEASLAGVVVVGQDGIVRFPPHDKILASVTIMRARSLLAASIRAAGNNVSCAGGYSSCDSGFMRTCRCASELCCAGSGGLHIDAVATLPAEIKGFECCALIPSAKLAESKEIIMGNGELIINSVVSVDGVKIGDGKQGPLALWLKARLVAEAMDESNSEPLSF